SMVFPRMCRPWDSPSRSILFGWFGTPLLRPILSMPFRQFLLICCALALTPMTSLASVGAEFSSFDRRAINGEQLSVVFLGGSLTWGAQATDPQLTSYRALMSRKLEA